MYTPALILAVCEDKSIWRPLGLVPLSIMYNMKFDLYMATCMLVNLAKERIINVSPLHRVVKYDKKMPGSVFKNRERE